MEGSRDQWADWVLRRSHGGDQEQKRLWLEELAIWREGVLKRAQPSPGETLLDIGTGDGLIGFGALPLLGDSGRVIFSDISADLLRTTQELAAESGLLDRCSFVAASADDLSPLEDASVDIVTTRAVLIYVRRKEEAFREFYRVLRPGGRISLCEPINQYFAEDRTATWGFDVSALPDIMEKIESTWHTVNRDDAGPMMDFDEGDLLAFAESAGFEHVHIDLEIVRESGSWVTSWNALLDSSGNPLDPTLRESMERVLSPAEIDRFERHVRPQVEAGIGVKKSALAFVWAQK